MQILSKFKDYYDYVPHQLGVDKSIVFDRNKKILTDLSYTDLCVEDDRVKKVFGEAMKSLPGGHEIKSLDRSIYTLPYEECVRSIDYLVLLGRIMPICSVGKYDTIDLKYVLLSNTDPDLLKKSVRENSFAYMQYTTKEDKTHVFLNNQTNVIPSILELNKRLRVPYFVLSCSTWFRKTSVVDAIPELQKIKGLINYFPPEELYKEIYNFFVDVRTEEHKDKPKPLDDISKIHKAGFDTKISFRKRKE